MFEFHIGLTLKTRSFSTLMLQGQIWDMASHHPRFVAKMLPGHESIEMQKMDQVGCVHCFFSTGAGFYKTPSAGDLNQQFLPMKTYMSFYLFLETVLEEKVQMTMLFTYIYLCFTVDNIKTITSQGVCQSTRKHS